MKNVNLLKDLSGKGQLKVFNGRRATNPRKLNARHHRLLWKFMRLCALFLGNSYFPLILISSIAYSVLGYSDHTVGQAGDGAGL